MKPDRLYRLETKNAPGKYADGYNPKRNYTLLHQAEDAVRRLRYAGADVKLFYTDCDWKEMK